MRKIFTLTGNLLLVAGILLLMAVSLTPAQLGFSLHGIISGSMEPALNTGGLIALRTTSPEKIELEDIICFKTEDSDVPICHRVINIEATESGRFFRTKGDALEEADNWVIPEKNLLGKVIYHVPWVGRLSSDIRTPTGFFITVVIPAIIIITLEIIDFLKPTRRKRQKASALRKNTLNPANSFLQIGIAVIGFLWLLIAGNTQSRALNSFAAKNTDSQPYTSIYSRTIRNDGYLPLIICIKSIDESIIFKDNHFLLMPGEEKDTEIYNGQEDSLIVTRGFLPSLPPKTLLHLFEWNPLLSPLISVAVPLSPFLALGWYLLGGNSSTREEHRARARQMEASWH